MSHHSTYFNQKSKIKQSKKIRKRAIRFFVFVFLVGLILGQMQFFVPEKTYAAAGGDTLTIRVGYFGDDRDYRVKVTFTRAQLEAMASGPYYYSNANNVGNVRGVVAEGVPITTLLNAAGIDLGSIQTIHPRTYDGVGTDGRFGQALQMNNWINATRYYYPNLRGNTTRADDTTFVPNQGSLQGATSVPAILSVRDYTTTDPFETLLTTKMNSSQAYRFCAGQSPLQEGVQTTAADVTSQNAAYGIFGLDICLYGSPKEATNLSLDLADTSLKIGSRKLITASVAGISGFEDLVNKTVTWSSSNPDIISVDNTGLITVNKKGSATITATTSNGISKSVLINGEGEDKKEEENPKKEDPAKKDKKKEDKRNDLNAPIGEDGKPKTASSGVKDALENASQDKGLLFSGAIREIKIGDAAAIQRADMAQDAVALDKQAPKKNVVMITVGAAYIIIMAGAIGKLITYIRGI